MALAGSCSGPLCTKHLYIFRETPEKSPLEVTALLITDPKLATALVPEASDRINQGLPWAPEQLEQPTDAYRLSLINVDGREVYQGQCLDTLITDVCEVRAGNRRLSVKVMLLGPWGRRSLEEDVQADLKAQTVYFLDIAGPGGREGAVQVKPEPLRDYTPEFRQCLLDWQRSHTVGRSLD
ncbi:MAG: hypothetical protein PHW74_10005 [Desulfobacca sp.]|nr:hypothetical protein [Desulfobacca sp.]